jgi:hypothetical protein
LSDVPCRRRRTCSRSGDVRRTQARGRKLVLTPHGADLGIAPRHRVDNAMVKALARAFRWRKMLETGKYAAIDEIAASERINSSNVRRVLRLTLLAPDIVEAILDGRQPVELTLAVLMQPFSICWIEQTLFVASARSAVIAEGRFQPPATSVVD